MPLAALATAAASRISPAMNSISFSRPASRRGLPRELSSSTRTLRAGAHQRLHQTRADEAAAAGDENFGAAHARFSWPAVSGVTSIQVPCWCERRAASIMRLHAIAFGKSGRLPCRRFRWRRRIAWPAATPVRSGRREIARRPGPRLRCDPAARAAWRKTGRSRACSRRPDWPSTSVPSSPKNSM